VPAGNELPLAGTRSWYGTAGDEIVSVTSNFVARYRFE